MISSADRVESNLPFELNDNVKWRGENEVLGFEKQLSCNAYGLRH